MKHAVGTAMMLTVLATSVPSWGQCPPSCPIPGGGDPASDCHAEFAATALHLNFPPFDPAAPQPRTEVRCFDGDAGCDTDGVVDNACVFNVDVCLRNADPALAECTPADVTSVSVEAGSDPDLAALQTALTALTPATTNVCTTNQRLRVPLQGPNPAGGFTLATKTVQLQAGTGAGADDDQLVLTCVPRGWPSHGYNHANHRSNLLETTLSPENAAQLSVKWHLDLGALENNNSAVAGTPAVGNGLLYIPGRRKLFAVEPETGEIRWTYGAAGGVTSSPTLTADGRVLLSDSTASVYCLDAVSGKLLWQKSYSAQAPDHMWASPVVANNRVIIGIASHSDIPCTQGRLLGIDLDTGNVLWDNLKTVPDRICSNDTAIECEENADCGGGTCANNVCDNDETIECDEDADCGGTCIAGRGAGVTATVAVDPTGETIYMNTVGCYTYPSIGDSDSMFRVDAATGEVLWKTRVQLPEQFAACSNDQRMDCRNDDDCDGGTCETKAAYHDFGFLNGPVLLPAEAGVSGQRPLVVSGSKDGTLYSFDPEDGSVGWTNEVVPTPFTPGFAGFGLFNGAIAYANERIYAALFVVVPATNPAPDHLQAFSTEDGSSAWTDDIGPSWSNVTTANNLLFAGTEIGTNLCERSRTPCEDDSGCTGEPCVTRGPFFVYDARNGTRLKEFAMPGDVIGGAVAIDGSVYVPYYGNSGGVVALGLPACPGDCNRDGNVTVDEVVRGVNIALEASPVDVCFPADRDSNWLVAINELVSSVNSLIGGCGENAGTQG